MRPAAEIREVALPIEGDRTVRGVNQLGLVHLAVGFEQLPSFVRTDLPSLPLAALGDLTAHLVLEPGEIVLADRLGKLEVVVEAVIDRRADRHLGAGEQTTGRLGEQMCCRVTKDAQRI